MPLHFLNSIATLSSDHTIPSPSFSGDVVHFGFVSPEQKLVVPEGYATVPVDIRTKVSAYRHSTGVFFVVDSPSDSGRDLFLLTPTGQSILIFSTPTHDRNILREIFTNSSGVISVIFSVVGALGDTQLYVFTQGKPLEVIYAPSSILPKGSNITELATHFPGVISDLKIIEPIGKIFFSVRSPGVAASNIYHLDFLTSRVAYIYYEAALGVIESLAPCLVQGQIYCFFMTLSRRSQGSISYISKELYLLQGKSNLVEVVVEGYEAARNLHAFFDGSYLNLCYLTDTSEAHPRSIFWIRTEDLASRTPLWHVSYLKPLNQYILGFSFIGNKGLFVSEGSPQSLYFLELPYTSSEPRINIDTPDSLSRLGYTPISVSIDNPEGLNLLTLWSCDSSSINILNTTWQSTSLEYGVLTPASSNLSCLVQRGFLTPMRVNLAIAVKPHRVPTLSEIPTLHLAWHELKTINIVVTHDPLFPPKIQIEASSSVSVGSTKPSLFQKNFTPPGVSIAEDQTSFTFDIRAWHVDTQSDLAFTIHLSDALQNYTSQDVSATFDSFDTSLLGTKFLTRAAYRGSIKSGNLGLGFQPSESCGLLIDFKKASIEDTSRSSSSWMLVGSRSVLFLDDWNSRRHIYLVSYETIRDSIYLKALDTCFILTSNSLHAYKVSSITPRKEVIGLSEPIYFWDNPDTTYSVPELLSSNPKNLVPTDCGCILVGDTDLSVFTQDTSIRIDVNSLGFPGFIIDRVSSQEVKSLLEGKLLILLEHIDIKFYVIYDLQTRSIQQVSPYSSSDLHFASLFKSSI